MKHKSKRRYKCKFMLGWPCILNYMNDNQHVALFIFNLLNCHTCTCLGRISSPSGGRMYICGKLLLFIIFSGSAAQRGLWRPRSRGFVITHDTPNSGLLWTSDQLVAETSTWQNTIHTTDKYPWPRWGSNTRSHQASDLRLTPRGHWDRSMRQMITVVFLNWLSAGLAS
jgi:hypothetical protein